MSQFVGRHPVWSLAILILVAILLYLIFAVWPPELEHLLGRKRVFLNVLFNGITLGGLYFMVASGFTLIFGLMRNVNLAHGSLYLLGGYIGFEIAHLTGSWIVSLVAAFIVIAVLGMVLQFTIFRWMEGQDLRQTLVTIAISIILADLMLWRWGGDFYQVPMPAWLAGPVQVPLITAMRGDGELVFLQYPLFRLVIFLGAVAIGVLMWLALNRTKIGMVIRAGVDDRDMLSASGIRVQVVFVIVFAFGAGLAGMAGVVGGTFQSLQPGEDIKIILASLVVVIVGGMGSITGAAVGALMIGLAEQFGSAYTPTYAVVFTFIIMVVVLAVRPQGLLRGR
jgi:branched-chain amino acid transport system permease protein